MKLRLRKQTGPAHERAARARERDESCETRCERRAVVTETTYEATRSQTADSSRAAAAHNGLHLSADC